MTWKSARTDGKLDFEHAPYRDVDGREHGFEERDRNQSRDDMSGTVQVKDQQGRTVEAYAIHGMEIEGGRRDE